MKWHWIALPLTLTSALHCLPANADEGAYQVTSLVTDKTDANLVNPWGIAFNPNAFVWIANNGSGTATLYDGAGNPAPPPPAKPLVVTIPQGKPTGLVFNGTTDFTVNTKSTPFIFASEAGVISAWAPGIDPNNAQQIGPTHNAIYKGLALAANGKGNFLYATDFRNAKIDVFDGTFQDALALHELKCDFHVDVPRGFAPFGIQNINGDLYVSYAKQDQDKEDDVAGPGLGLIVVFDADGCLVRRFTGGWPLNAPWGIALAPADFGQFGNRLLVGNFGDGAINAFDLHTGAYVGTLRGTNHRPLHIDGLWGLRFGNGVLDQGADSLFFTAGPNDESGGLYGRIDPAPRRY
jgi:uncharacterized protein (TIGR03118 family)